MGLIQKAVYKPVTEGTGEHLVVNGLSVNQGPNYAVAKIMQRWRAIAAREEGSLVSMTAGPAAKTDSVMHSPTMKVIMLNMEVVKPLIAHDPETVQALMTLIFIRDISSETAVAKPTSKLGHPMELFYENAWDGGLWRSPYNLESAGTFIFIRHYLRLYGAIPVLLGFAWLAYCLFQ